MITLGDDMKIYLDLVFFMNFFFDLLLLLTVKLVLKKKTTWFRIIGGALIGAVSLVMLFLPLNSFTLFVVKILMSIFMIRVTFGWMGIRTFGKDLLYLYFVSIILGGFLYYLNLEFSYQNVGVVFFHNGFSINFCLLLILTPVILFLTIKQNQVLKGVIHTRYLVSFSYRKKKYQYQAYLDTGNKLYDPYGNLPVILLYDPSFKLSKQEKVIYVPYETLEHKGVICCFKVNKLEIDGEVIDKKLLIGISKEPFRIEGADMVLHPDFIL